MTNPRFEPSPFRRRSDRIQAAARVLVGALFVLGCLAAVTLGMRAYQTQEAREQADGRVGYQVTARVLSSASVQTSIGDTGASHRSVHVSWRDPRGTEQRRRLTIANRPPHRSTLDLWIDSTGNASLQVRPTGQSLPIAVRTSIATAAAITATLTLAYTLLVHVLNWNRYRQWEIEWANVEPRWRR